METVTFTKKEYFDLLEIKKSLEKILEKKEKPAAKKEWLESFGILKDNLKGESLDYVSNLRKEWRKYKNF